MFVVPMEKAWKNYSICPKFAKLQKIFDGRQDGSLTGLPYCQNPKLPPSALDVFSSLKTKQASIMNDTSI